MTKETSRKVWLKPNCIGNLDPLPEGNGKGYHPDLNGNKVQRGYPLPSALADGHRNQQQKVIANSLSMEIGKRRECGNLMVQEIASCLAITGNGNL